MNMEYDDLKMMIGSASNDDFETILKLIEYEKEYRENNKKGRYKDALVELLSNIVDDGYEVIIEDDTGDAITLNKEYNRAIITIF